MRKVKTYEEFNEEINLKKGLAGLALGASLLGGQSCVKTDLVPSTRTEVISNNPNAEAGPIFMQVESGRYRLEYYNDDNTFTYDREISELLSKSPAYTITRKFSIRSGTFNYEYVLFEGNSKYKYTGTYQVYNYNEYTPPQSRGAWHGCRPGYFRYPNQNNSDAFGGHPKPQLGNRQ